MNSIKYIFTAISGLLVGLSFNFFVSDFDFFKPVFEMLLIASLGATGSFFLEFCFRPGNIFGWWLKFLDRYFYENKKNPFRFLYKPLGGCGFCFNVWLTTGLFSVYWWLFGSSVVFYWWLIPSIFFSHLILFYLSKHFDLD